MKVLSSNIALVTDFNDYYDHYFASSWNKSKKPWSRYQHSNLSKRNQLLLLEELGCTPPKHGIVSMLDNSFSANDTVVVYLDEYLHNNGYKQIHPYQVALNKYPRHYCSQFIPTTKNPLKQSISYRLLVVGNMEFAIAYSSSAWISNSDGFTEILDMHFSTWNPHKRKHPALIKYPFFAIDFVVPHENPTIQFAIALNTTPKIKGTGLENSLKAKECASAIAESLVDNNCYNF